MCRPSTVFCFFPFFLRDSQTINVRAFAAYWIDGRSLAVYEASPADLSWLISLSVSLGNLLITNQKASLTLHMRSGTGADRCRRAGGGLGGAAVGAKINKGGQSVRVRTAGTWEPIGEEHCVVERRKGEVMEWEICKASRSLRRQGDGEEMCRFWVGVRLRGTAWHPGQAARLTRPSLNSVDEKIVHQEVVVF